MVKKEKKSDSNKISKVKLSETSLLSLEEFLDKLLLGKLNSKSNDLSKIIIKKQVNLCTELYNCFANHQYALSKSANLNRLNREQILKLVKKTNNQSLLLACLETHFDQKIFLIIFEKLCLSQQASLILDFIKAKKNRAYVDICTESLLTSKIYKNANQINFRIDLFKSTLDIESNHKILLLQLNNDVSSELINSLDSKESSKLVDIFSNESGKNLIGFILSLKIELVAIETMRNLRSVLTSLDIAKLLRDEALSVSEQHLAMIFEPRIKELINDAITLDTLIPLLVCRAQLKKLGLLDLASARIKEFLGKKGELALILEDPFLKDIEEKNFKMNDVIGEQKLQIDELNKDLSSTVLRVEKLKVLLAQADDKNLGSSRQEIATRDQRDKQVKIEFLKELVKYYENNPDNLKLILEKFGLEEIGAIGETLNWDPETCESITRESITSGLVVKTGFIWWDGNTRIVLKRVLLKVKSL